MLADKLEEAAKRLRDGDEPHEVTGLLVDALAETETNVGDVAEFVDTFGEESGAIVRALTALTDKGLDSDEIAEFITSVSYTQIQPSNDDFLDDGAEALKATDIGRRILRRERKGGRPSKVEQAIDEVEDAIEWYSGQQMRQRVRRELEQAKRDMSRPTWNKFKDQADEVLNREVGEDVESFLTTETV